MVWVNDGRFGGLDEPRGIDAVDEIAMIGKLQVQKPQQRNANEREDRFRPVRFQGPDLRFLQALIAVQ